MILTELHIVSQIYCLCILYSLKFLRILCYQTLRRQIPELRAQHNVSYYVMSTGIRKNGYNRLGVVPGENLM
jgi:hypothetical protein